MRQLLLTDSVRLTVDHHIALFLSGFAYIDFDCLLA